MIQKRYLSVLIVLLCLIMVTLPMAARSETMIEEEVTVDNRWVEGKSPLSGQPVVEGQDNQRVFAYSVDNMVQARWAAGLRSAEIIFEFKNELHTSRFLALFMTQEIPEYIGSIRSARPFMVHRLIEFDAIFSHAGGSSDGNIAIQTFGVQNYDAIYLPEPYFWRYNATGKVIPHDLYTSMQVDIAKAEAFNYDLEPSDFIAYLFQEDVLPIHGEPTLVFEIELSPNRSNVKRYEYQEEEAYYHRYDDGLLHIDELDQLPLTPVSIIVQEALSTVYDDVGHRKMAQIGTGKGLYFSHGEVIEITWEKETETAQTFFYTTDGAELVLNPGQIFIQVVDSLDNVAILNPEPPQTEETNTP